jgi:hypothetical protein
MVDVEAVGAVYNVVGSIEGVWFCYGGFLKLDVSTGFEMSFAELLSIYLEKSRGRMLRGDGFLGRVD